MATAELLGSPLIINLGLRLSVEDHRRLIAYADAMGLSPGPAIRRILRQVLPVDTGQAVVYKTRERHD